MEGKHDNRPISLILNDHGKQDTEFCVNEVWFFTNCLNR